MREPLRKSGIDIIGDVPWGTHFCQFYQTREDLIDILVPYFKAGLENNELCVWIISQPLEVKEAKEALRKVVPDIDVYLESGQMEIAPYNQRYLKEGIFDPDWVVNSWVEKINQSLARGYDGLRAAGDNRWLEKEGWNGFVDYENKVDAIIDKSHVIAICPYYLDMCNTVGIIDVVSSHQFALIKKEGKWERVENSGRKRAEKEAIQAAKNWKYTFDAVPDLIAIIDNEYRIVSANRSMAERLGMTPEECVGLTCYRLIHGVGNPPSFCRRLQLLKKEAEHTAEVYEDCLGGYFVVSTSPLHDSEGKLIGSIYVARDINERKKVEEKLQESEEKYRNIVETANEGILTIDSEVRITYVNKKIIEMLGYSLEELIGRFLWDFADEKSMDILKLNMEKRRQDINDVYELELICKDGSPLWALISAKALFNKEGGFMGSLGMFTDITERKQEEHRISRYNLILEGINRIFSNAVQAKTEEELGNVCLSVALELTGSQFGFINEMGADGRLHDVAKSELGWEQCFMYDKTGHRRPPSVFAVHGLYGSVINNEKGFFTNDPPSHPDSIGIPEGHPPITSFLGVPLVQGGKTIGLIAVANREGGYSCEQQEDLEAIAPAVVQSLQRKKAEQKRKQAEEALRVSEERYRSLYENSLDGILLTKPDGTILCANPQACQMFDMTEDEIIRIGRDDLVVNDENLAAALEERRLTGQARAELTYRRKDGSTLVCDTTSKLFVDADGNINTSQIIRDISKRKQAEEALLASEEKFRKMVETASEGIWLIDSNERTVFVNRKMSEMLGYNIEEILGQSPRKFMSPEFCAKADDRLREHTQGGNQVVDYSFIRKSGSELWCIVSSSPLFDDQGKYAGALAMITDITERKQAEEALLESKLRLKLAQVSAGAGMWDWDISANRIEWSEELFQLFGLDPGKTDASFDSLKNVLHPDDRLIVEKRIKNAVNNCTSFSTEYRIVLPSGEVRWINALGNTTCDSGGKPQRMSGICIDITMRKKAEEVLKEAHGNLEKIVEERTEELEKAYNSLKESENGLAEAQRMAHIGNWDWDLVTGEVYWSNELYNIFGRSHEESSPSYDELLNYIHPDDRDYVDKSIQNGLNEEPKSGIDYRIVLANGEERTVYSQAEVIFNEQKIPVRVKGIVQDITERKRIEAELELVARLPRENPDPVMRLTQGHIINYANPSAQALLADWGSEVNQEAPAEITELSVAALGDGIRRKLECTYANRTYMINIAPFTGAGYVNLYAHDITESKKAKEALERIDKIRIKEIHHRIKNNLQVISSLLNLQAERFRNKEVLEAFRESQDRVTSMSLIHEELYKGEKNDTLNFSAYLQKLAESLFQTYSLKSKNVYLSLDLEENTFFDMDVAVPLGIIVNELVSNSLKHAFTEEKEGEIRIKLCREEKGNEMHKSSFSLTISDNGKGIPENIKFENLESLGLQLVNILVDQLDGKIELNRTHGTEFRITFKLAERP